jgi:serine/threonine protein kinase
MLDEKVNNSWISASHNNDSEGPAWTIDNFEMGECLGNGKFGYVYRAVEKTTKKTLAIKVVCKNTINQYHFYDQLRNEVEIHSRLK